MASQVPLTFEIYRIDPAGDELIRTETINADKAVKIGKLSSSHLKLEDEGVSRVHAVIELPNPQELFITDLGSSKGTIVNGQKVSKVKLQSGDTIVLGGIKLVLKIGAPIQSESAAAPPPATRATMMGMKAISPDSLSAPSPAAAPPAPVPPTPAPPAPQKTAPTAPTVMREAPSIPAPVPAPAPFAPAPAPFAAAPAVPAPFAPAPAPAPFAAAPAAAAPRAFAPPAGFDSSAVELLDGSKAIEVTAMFQDAVLDLRHFSNPKAGDISGATKGILGSGAAALLIAAITFVVSVVQAAAQARAWDAWDKLNKPHMEFLNTIPRSGPGLDILVSACLAYGIFAAFFGLYRLFDERQPRDYTIGPDALTLFKAPGELLPVANFPLVHSTGTEYEVLVTPQMTGDVTVDGKTLPLAQLASSGVAHRSSVVSDAVAYTIPNNARIKIDLGQNTFLVSSVPPPRHYPTPFQINWSQQAYTLVTGLCVFLFLGMIYSIPPDPKSLSLDAFMNDQRFAKFVIKPPEEKEEQMPDWLKKKDADEAGGKGKRHKDEEGKMGKKESKQKTGLYALKGPKDNPDPHLAKQLADESAQKAGVLGIMKSQEGSILASVFGRDSAVGSDEQNVLGGLVGTAVGEAYGNGGLGVVGTGKGGGGTGEGTIGLGNLGTIGKGGGGGNGAGYGRGVGGLGTRRAKAPEIVPGTAQVTGSLDKEIIRRIIRRHLAEVRFCYESELLKKPDLYGRVMVQFTISGVGQVVASVVSNSTLNNGTVEQCIAGAVRRWEFPKPQGGGIVVVSYPFVLKAAD